jgi:hypothetical protein
MDRIDRDGRDAAGVGPYAHEREHLTALSTLDSWTVSDGEPDIRGWEVRTVAGRQLGSVSDLLIDSKAGEVVLLDIDLPGNDRHTFVPIRGVEIDRGRRVILMDSADLPDSDLVRGDHVVPTGRRAIDAGTVRYPRSDRQVLTDRPLVADSVAKPVTGSVIDTAADNPRIASLPAPETSIAENSVDRRIGDRRHIDRMSTDL